MAKLGKLGLLQFKRNDVDTEFEKKAFQVCDTDGDGALDWQELENCEVNKTHFLENDLGNTKRNLGCTAVHWENFNICM